jgi:hypothetical protein
MVHEPWLGLRRAIAIEIASTTSGASRSSRMLQPTIMRE